MLSTDAFAEWSKEVVLCLHVTSKTEGEPHPDLLRELGGNGYPTLTYVAPDGRVLMQLAHPTTLDTMKEGLARLRDWKELRTAAARDPKLRKQLFLTELRFGMLASDAARKQMASYVFTEDESSEVSQRIVDLEFTEIVRTTPSDKAHEAGAKFVAMLRADRVPQTRQITTFWQYIFQHAGAERDTELFAEMLDEMKRRHAGDKRVERYGGMLERQLEALRRANEKARDRSKK